MHDGEVHERPRRDRLHLALAWGGVLTVAAITVLAGVQLAGDIVAVLSIRGGLTAVAVRLLPFSVLLLAGLLLVGAGLYAAGRGRRGEALAIGVAFGLLILVRAVLAASSDGVRLGEPAWYDLLTDGVRAGECCFADRPMGYPLMLAGVEVLLGDRRLSIEALNIVLAVLAGGAVAALARSQYGPRAAVLALLGYALWPAGALMVPVGIPQGAYDVAIVAAAWTGVATPRGWRGSAVTGAILGVAQYLRPTTPLLLPAFVLARLWPAAPWRAAVGGVALPILAAFLIVIAPVVAHNLGSRGELSVSTSSFSGHTLYVGTDMASGGRYDREAGAALARAAGPDVRAQSELGASIALERIRSDPLGIAWLAVRKQATLWASERFGVEYGISRRLADQTAHPASVTAVLLSQAFYVLVLATTTVSLASRRRRLDALAAFAIALIWSLMALHALAEVRDRYHSYVIPVLLPIAAAAIVAGVDRAASRSRGTDELP